MKVFSLLVGAVSLLMLAGASPAQAGHSDPVAEAQALSQSVAADDARYALAGQCVTLQPQATTNLIAAPSADHYRASAILPEQAERFRMQATDLGSYLMLGSGNDLLAAGSTGRVVAAPEPTKAADWEVEPVGDAFTITSRASGDSLVMGGSGVLGLASARQAAAAGDAARFNFAAAEGCIPFPESELNVVGKPRQGDTPYGQVHGLLDAHSHMMGFEAFGGNLHCGRPWSPMGITVALHDCPDHYPNGSLALVENIASYQDPTHMHDPVGWPTFKDWPDPDSYTHENVYYRWLERTYRSGLRLFVMLAVDNSALCQVNPHKKFPCNDMLAVRREIKDTYALQDYIDAQYGGPGKGWFRIVKTPFEAREVINQGKLAVVLGIEVSELFDCGLRNDVPQCDRRDIDRSLDEFYGMGVRQMELVNKFDNALSGVAFDGGVTGVIVNVGNRAATGRFWSMEPCTAKPYDQQPTPVPAGSTVEALVRTIIPQGVLPVYPEGPVCNPRGLTGLGEHALRGMMERGMIFDPDHMSVRARQQSLSLMDAADYTGVISSHSWSDNPSYKRIYKLGGFVAPMQGVSPSFVKTWKERKRLHRDSKSSYHFAMGFGDDMNGFAGQANARDDAGENPLVYPFQSPIDEGITVDRQVTGERVFDINEDGVAHYGLFADWVEDLRLAGGDGIIKDLAAGPEAYLQMWERSVGIKRRCLARRAKLAGDGIGRVRLGLGPLSMLRQAGQPLERPERAYAYCISGKRNARADLVTIFTPHGKSAFVASDARSHRAGAVRPGAPAARIPADARPLGSGALVDSAGSGHAVVYGTRAGKVSFVGVAEESATKSAASLRPYLRLARRAGLG